MTGRSTRDQRQLFYLFNLEDRIPADHLLRRINPFVTGVLAELPPPHDLPQPEDPAYYMVE